MKNKWLMSLIILIRVGTSVHVNPEGIVAMKKDGRGTLMYVVSTAGPVIKLKSDWSYEVVLKALFDYVEAGKPH